MKLIELDSEKRLVIMIEQNGVLSIVTPVILFYNKYLKQSTYV